MSVTQNIMQSGACFYLVLYLFLYLFAFPINIISNDIFALFSKDIFL